jgi:Na+-driven multidrug efflux pump
MNACWIGQGRPHLAFLVTAIQVPAQIAATFALVLGFGPIPAFGATGAGAAWTFSSLVGVIAQLALAARPGAIPGLARARPRAAGALAAASIAWPISLQQTLLQMGLIVLYLIVARLGVAVVAATNVLVTLGGVPSLLAVGVGIAAATLVGQSLGRGDMAEARRWGWRASGLGVALGAPFALAFLVWPRWVLGLFLHDPATLAIAVWPLRIFAACLAAEMALRVLSFALRGAGATLLGAGIPFAVLWLVQLPLSWLVAVPLGFGLLGLACVQSGMTVIEAVVTALVWAGALWAGRRIVARA